MLHQHIFLGFLCIENGQPFCVCPTNEFYNFRHVYVSILH